MRFALVQGQKAEAAKGSSGFCPCCGSKLVARCGEVNVNHWAHKGNRNCDQWWENETTWHRSWKDKFPVAWQERIHTADNGEKHIADVKTDSGWAIEFQHSYLKPEERRSRILFYPKLIWVVDSLRRKTDKTQFQKIVQESIVISKEPLIRRVSFPEECRLLREWHNPDSMVFFDFQDPEGQKQIQLWYLFPKTSNGIAYLSPFSRKAFIDLHNSNKFDDIIKEIFKPVYKFVLEYEQFVRARAQLYTSMPLSRFDQHLTNKRRNRGRL